MATKLSQRSAADTVSRLTDLIRVKGLKLFAVIDQAEAAREVRLAGIEPLTDALVDW